jgi:hypothetical protein
MAASYDALCPVIVTSDRVPDDVYRGGHGPAKHFSIERNSKPDVNVPLFERVIRCRFISHI